MTSVEKLRAEVDSNKPEGKIAIWFIEECQMGDEAMEYAKKLVSDGYDVVDDLIESVEESEWEEFIPKKGHRKRVLARIAKIKEENKSAGPEMETPTKDGAGAGSRTNDKEDDMVATSTGTAGSAGTAPKPTP